MSVETILSVEEYRGGDRRHYSAEAGFKITTSEQEIILAIDDQSSCCEEWGYFLTENDATKFVGAELRGVTLTDTNRSSRKFASSWSKDFGEDDVSLDEGEVMFVDIETDRGVLQFVAYNAHNGYYGHAARVVSKQLSHEAQL